ncbi:MAG: GTP-binding protein [Candidatus Heimdallarchaeota archaeon]
MNPRKKKKSTNTITKRDLETKMPLEKRKDNIIKIAIAGVGGVGKTTLCQRAMGRILDDYFSEYKITIGVQFFTHNMDSEVGPICLSIWDLAGQPQFHQIVDRFLVGAKGVILAYDSTKIDTYFSLHHTWMPLIKQKCGEDVPIVLVSTKNDLNEEKQVNPKLVWEFIDAKEENNHNIIDFLETSSKDNTNVKETFETLANKILAVEYERYSKSQGKNVNESIPSK